MAYPPPANEAAYPPVGPPQQHPGAPQQASYPPVGPPQQAWQPGQGGTHKWDDAPAQPIEDDPNAQLAPDQPPPASSFQSIQGYEGCGGFGQMSAMPPPPPPPPPSGQPPPMQFDDVGQLTEDDCREAMLEFVAKNCCYGKKPAQQMKMDQILPSTALHYTLETFCEVRNTGYAHDPYRGGMVDGPQNGVPPGPWQIPCEPTNHFNNHTKVLEVPHTSVVKQCHRCQGRGFLRCHRCHGVGWVRCNHCAGRGRVQRMNAEGQTEWDSCFVCGGDGRKTCFTCHGDGRVTCDVCKGFRSLRCYINLTVNYVNHKNDHIMEKTDMPDELVREVQGTLLFEQILPQVWPIIAFPVPEINQNSQRMVDQHRQSFNNERKLNQRHQLRAIPVTEVHYAWDDVKTRFWVYGREREVYSPDYPQQCCWGCSIL